MATNIYVSYFNAFGIKSATNTGVIPNTNTKNWHVEESRIKGGFNEDSVNLGVRAYLVNEDYGKEERKNALTYSGIYNSKTKVNDTNVFSIGDSITKAVDSGYGSIQKLHAEETNLLIIQEDKTSYALIDKDAIFSAEGSGSVTSTQKVIGQIVPFTGRYGTIDPNSFAYHGGRKYFADRNRGCVVRLSKDGITEISNYGMRDFFKDNLTKASRIVGMWDGHDKQYVLSLQDGSLSNINNSNERYYTLSFDEQNLGWTSFYTYKPSFGGSLNGNFYTLKRQGSGTDYQDLNLYKHYDEDTERNQFYGSQVNESSIKFVVNTNNSIPKVFSTISYEGDKDWKVTSIITDSDKGNEISKYELPSTAAAMENLIFKDTFKKKDNKYYASIKNTTAQQKSEILFGEQMSGVKGYWAEIEIKTDNDGQEKIELYSVDVNATKIN